MPDEPDLTVGMLISTAFGQARVVEIDLPHLKLGLSGGLFMRVVIADLDYQVIKMLEDPVAALETRRRQLGELFSEPLSIEPPLLAWLLATCRTPQSISGIPIAVIGSGPFNWETLIHLMAIPALDDMNFNLMSTEPEIVLVGRRDWEGIIDKLLQSRIGQTVRVYSQEMFLAWVLSGCDPFDSEPEVIRGLAGDHPALAYLEQVARL